MKVKLLGMLFLLTVGMATQMQAQETKSFNEKDFKGIANSTPATVNVYQSPNFKIEVTAEDRSIFDEMEIYTEDNILKIKSKERFWNFGDNWKNVTINIWMPEIALLSVNGSGDIYAKTAIKTTDIKLSINGSGSVNVDEMEAKEVTVGINGSGSVLVKGKAQAEELTAKSNGSGDIRLEGLSVDEAFVSLNGSGSAKILCNKEFKGKINGSGSIVLHGSPLIDAKVNGSGRLIRK